MKPMNIDFSSPQVMAILNVTPDSFYAGSRTPEAESVERRVREAVSEGAQLIDVRGLLLASPGADEVPADEEWRRVRLGVGTVRRLAPGMTVSVDTFRSEVAAKAVETFGRSSSTTFGRGTRPRDALRSWRTAAYPTSPCT